MESTMFDVISPSGFALYIRPCKQCFVLICKNKYSLTHFPVTINGTYPNQRLLGFMLVAVPDNAEDESTTMGTFQVGILHCMTLFGRS